MSGKRPSANPLHDMKADRTDRLIQAVFVVVVLSVVAGPFLVFANRIGINPLGTLARVAEIFDDYGALLTALFTAAVAWFTWSLSDSTKKLWQESTLAGETARESARAASRSADAAVKTSMPVLYPWVANMEKLHPRVPRLSSFTHEANILLGFDNFGKTPATIREVRAKLFLTVNDASPNVDPASLPSQSYSVIVPGENRVLNQNFGLLDFKQSIEFKPEEILELISEATGNFRRFMLAGHVVYDDFFGQRHISRFCVKLRVWQTQQGLSQFQVAHGGSRHNRIQSAAIPEPDPLYP